MPATTALPSADFLTGLLAERTRAELTSAFGEEFALWRPGQPWPLAGEIPAEVAAQENNVNDAQRASVDSRPWLVGVGEDEQLLRVPIVQETQISVYAVALLPARWPRRLVLKSARLVLDKIRADDELQRLHLENQEHVVQLTQDLEELTFLRSISEHLDVSEARHDMWDLARLILPLLRHSINAESLALVSAVADGDAALPAAPVLEVGVRRWNHEGYFTFIQQLREQADEQPLVQNRLRRRHEPGTPAIDNLILVPLRKANRILGWLLAVNRIGAGNPDQVRWALSQHEFGTNEATLLASAASILATHAMNFELVRDQEKLVANVVRSLVSTIEAKDPYTRGHSERVALFAKHLAKHLGYSDEECERIYLTSLVHDVGKIGVSDAILNKATRLTDIEFEEIKRHPDEGWAILRDLEQLSYVLPGVLHHHERYDGCGYPDRLAADNIPLDGRIIAVADAYDAMTSNRAYRNPMSQAQAAAELRGGAGRQWDPRVVEAFFAVEEELASLREDYQPEPKAQRKRPAACQSN